MKEYILTLCASAIVVSLTSILISEGAIKKYANLASSLIISLSIVLPLTSIIGADIFYEFPTEDYSLEYNAEERYNEMVKEEYKTSIEEKLSSLGRTYAFIADDMTVLKIEMYRKTPLSDNEKAYIEENYAPLELEVYYE